MATGEQSTVVPAFNFTFTPAINSTRGHQMAYFALTLRVTLEIYRHVDPRIAYIEKKIGESWGQVG